MTIKTAQAIRHIAFEDLGSFEAPLREAGYDIEVPVLHWHGDTFILPEGDTFLASTALCTNQAFSRGPNVLGLQFHPEVRGARFEHWLLGHGNELATAGIDPGTLRRDARRHGGDLEKAGAGMLAAWLSQLTR